MKGTARKEEKEHSKVMKGTGRKEEKEFLKRASSEELWINYA